MTGSAKELDEKVSALLCSINQNVEALEKITNQANEMVGTISADNAELNRLIEEKDGLMKLLEEDVEKHKKKIVDMNEVAKQLRDKNGNQKEDIKDLRQDKKDLEELFDKVCEELKTLKMSTSQAIDSLSDDVSDGEVLEMKIPDSERGKYIGIFIHSTEVSRNKAEEFFQKLQKCTPQINWGKDPVEVHEGQSVGIAQGTTIVAMLCWKVSHPLWYGIKKTAQLNGCHVISENRFGKMVGQIQEWLLNPHFGETKPPYPVRGGGGHK